MVFGFGRKNKQQAAKKQEQETEQTLVATAELATEQAEPIKTLLPTEKQHNATEENNTNSGYFSRLKKGLAKTGAGFSNLFLGKKTIDDELLEDLEAALLTADVGIEATQEILDDITNGISRKALNDPNAVIQQLKSTMRRILGNSEQPLLFSEKKTICLINGWH